MQKPKAYKNVDLDIHLTKVGEAVALTGYDILTAQTPVLKKIEEFTKVKNSLLISSILAGAFHDIGKASMYYQETLKSFYLHEYLSGILLNSTAIWFLKRGKDNLACIFNLSAWSAVRHHVAMIRRHPKEIITNNENLNEIMNAIKKFDITVAKEGLPDIIKSSKLLNELLSSWSELKSINSPDKLWNRINELANIKEKTPMVCNLSKDYWISAVEITTGPVIMADILVSQKEGRESDDKTSNLYSDYWINELGIKDKLTELINKEKGFENLEKVISEVEKLL